MLEYCDNREGEIVMATTTRESFSSDIMTLKEMAQYLRLSEKTIVRMIQAGDLPASKVASRWRFMRTVIDQWLAPRMKAVSTKDLVGIIRTAEHVIPLSQLITPDRIILSIKPGTQESVLSQLIEPLCRERIISVPDEYLRKLLDRENVVSTAIGHGVAAPHIRDPERSHVMTPCIVLGICREGTDFQALDGRKTYVFGLICSNYEDVHLRLMAKISLLFRKPGIVRALRQATSKEDVLSLLAATDREIGSGKR